MSELLKSFGFNQKEIDAWNSVPSGEDEATLAEFSQYLFRELDNIIDTQKEILQAIDRLQHRILIQEKRRVDNQK